MYACIYTCIWWMLTQRVRDIMKPVKELDIISKYLYLTPTPTLSLTPVSVNTLFFIKSTLFYVNFFHGQG